METTKNDFTRVLNIFRNGLKSIFYFAIFKKQIRLYPLAKQTLDNSLQACVDRYWTEILLNSLIFDRNFREVITFLYSFSLQIGRAHV